MMNKTLTIIFAITQILDGILTYLGACKFGSSGEGNIVIRSLMDLVGIPMSLIMVKGCALVLVYLFYKQCSQKLWYSLMSAWLICFYILVAIIPWCVVLNS